MKETSNLVAAELHRKTKELIMDSQDLKDAALNTILNVLDGATQGGPIGFARDGHQFAVWGQLMVGVSSHSLQFAHTYEGISKRIEFKNFFTLDQLMYSYTEKRGDETLVMEGNNEIAAQKIEETLAEASVILKT